MAFAKYFVSVNILLAVVGAVPSSQNAAHVFQRSALLEGRQSCPAGYIPACPVGIPCVPPGAICCDDGIHFVFPPDSCPNGSKPIATASNQGQVTTTAPPKPSSTSTSTSTSVEVPPTITESSTEASSTSVETSISIETSPTPEPTTTSTFIYPISNGTITSTGGSVPSPTFTQVPVNRAASLQGMGIFGVAALLPAVLLNWV